MDSTLQTTGDELLKDIYTLKVDIAKLKERKLVLTKELYRQFFDGELDHKRRLKWMESIDDVKEKEGSKEKKIKAEKKNSKAEEQNSVEKEVEGNIVASKIPADKLE